MCVLKTGSFLDMGLLWGIDHWAGMWFTVCLDPGDPMLLVFIFGNFPYPLASVGVMSNVFVHFLS